MKKVFISFLLLLIPLLAKAQTGTQKYETYVDPDFQFEVKYPKGLWTFGSNGEFLSPPGHHTHCFLNVSADPKKENRAWELEYDYSLSNDNLDAYRKATYEFFKRSFFVISGKTALGNIFYDKEIPIERHGKRFTLSFQMSFPEKDKEKWGPILKECALSFQLTRQAPSKGVSLGWIETPDQKFEGKLIREAKNWLNKNIQCSQAETLEPGEEGKSPLGNCTVDVRNITFFNLKASPATQFLLSVHGPQEGGPPSFVDCKYVLFTYADQKLQGNIIYHTQDGEWPDYFPGWLRIINVPSKEKILLMKINGGGGRGAETEILFQYVRGEMREVLRYLSWAADTNTVNSGLPECHIQALPDGNLRLLKQFQYFTQPNNDSDEVQDNYAEINFRFNSIQEKYLPTGKEMEVPFNTASEEWKRLSD